MTSADDLEERLAEALAKFDQAAKRRWPRSSPPIRRAFAQLERGAHRGTVSMGTRRPVELRAVAVTLRRHLALAAALLPLASCTYLNQRLDDLGDCFLYRFHQEALGLAIEGRVSILEASLGGWYADWGWGKDTWWQVPGHVMTTHGTGIPITTVGPIAYGQSWTRILATSTDGNPPAAPGAYDDVRSWLFVSDVFDLDDERRFALTPGQRISDAFGIELGIAPVICSVRIGVNVAEFADLLLGFVFLDVFGDDGWRRPPTLPYVPAVASGAQRE